MLPEQEARIEIDKQLNAAGWDIVDRNHYVPGFAMAVTESLMSGSKESDYLLYVDNKIIAVVEAKKGANELLNSNGAGSVVKQVEHYAITPQKWYGTWFDGMAPLVYLANGKKIYFRNLLEKDSEYEEIKEFHTPKQMLKMINKKSEYGALPKLDEKGLRECQFNAERDFEIFLRQGKRKGLAELATGSGKTYLACLASYRLLNYTDVDRVLFLVDRNNLGRQAVSEFSTFTMTEGKKALSDLYEIKRLVHNEDINANIVVSTIQKLYAVLTGQKLIDVNEDQEDEKNVFENDKTLVNEKAVDLGNNITLPPDYFQFIVIDECHRSIYGKWKSVLDYFKDAKILGLTATPTPETVAYFDKNSLTPYSYEESVVDNVNVPSRIYKISTEKTVHGGKISAGETIDVLSKQTSKISPLKVNSEINYSGKELDRSIVNANQIKTILTEYRDIIYKTLYTDREEKWEYIPKTLIFAKNDNHARLIVDVCKEVFKEKFESGEVPENFVKRITYSAGDSDGLIREFRTSKEFRIAVTVTLVSTGTDIKPLEVVMFMADVNSLTLYTQMKGRGCRTIGDDIFHEVTPNANSKDLYYIIDAIGVTEHEKSIPKTGTGGGSIFSLEKLLERLSHGELSDDNLTLLMDYCSRINSKYENNTIFGKYYRDFIKKYNFSAKTIAEKICAALKDPNLPEYKGINGDNRIRLDIISDLINNTSARDDLLELQRGYVVYSNEVNDRVNVSGFNYEECLSFTENFEKYLIEHKDEIEALRIIYNNEDIIITNQMLVELRDKLLGANKLYFIKNIWDNYRVVNPNKVDEYDKNCKTNALTNLIQIVRYVFKKEDRLYSLFKGLGSRFNLYCGMSQRQLSNEQKIIMKQIAQYIFDEGGLSINDINEIDSDLWRRGINLFGIEQFKWETNALNKHILSLREKAA